MSATAARALPTSCSRLRSAPGARQRPAAAAPQCQLQQPCSTGPWWPTAAAATRRRRPAPPVAAGNFFGGLFGGSSSGGDGSSSEAAEALETDDGGLMVPLDASSSGSLDGSSEAPFGPLALLAVGFTQLEFQGLQRLLSRDLGADMVRLVPGTPLLLAGPLGAALEADPTPAYEAAPLGTRRVVFMSGMYAAEVMEVIGAMRESGLPEAVFAAAVPNNYGRPVQELVQEVFSDHQAMKAQRQRQRLEQQQQQQQQQQQAGPP